MKHTLAKTILIGNLIELVAKEHHLSLDDARDQIYASEFLDSIDDDETGLYGDSPLHVFWLYEQTLSPQGNETK